MSGCSWRIGCGRGGRNQGRIGGRITGMVIDKHLDTDLRERIEREATTLDISRIAGYLQAHLGQKVTAYLAGLDNAKTVGLWISGGAAPRDLPKTRLRYAYQAARLIIE